VYGQCVVGKYHVAQAATFEAGIKIVDVLGKLLASESTDDQRARAGIPAKIPERPEIAELRDKVIAHRRQWDPIVAAAEVFKPYSSHATAKPGDLTRLRPSRDDADAAKAIAHLKRRLEVDGIALRATSVLFKRRADAHLSRAKRGEIANGLSELLKLDEEDRTFPEDETEKRRAERKKRIKEARHNVEKNLRDATANLLELKSYLVALTAVALVDPDAVRHATLNDWNFVPPKDEELPKSAAELKVATDELSATIKRVLERYARLMKE
jgi:hypothetical protein